MPSPIVIKIGGATLESHTSAPSLWRALVALHERTPGGLVLAHGGGKAVDRLLDKLGMETRRFEGLRITPPDQMDIIAGVLAGTLNKRLVGCLNAVGAKAVGLCLGDGNDLLAQKAANFPVDLGCVGEVTGGPGALLSLLLQHRYLPVVGCIAIDPAGQLLNVNGDDAAASLAKALHAAALVLITDVPGVLDKDKRVIPTLTADDIQRLAQEGVITGGMVPKLLAAASVANANSIPVTIMSGADTRDLERWAQGERVGTTIEPN